MKKLIEEESESAESWREFIQHALVLAMVTSFVWVPLLLFAIAVFSDGILGIKIVETFKNAIAP